MIQITPKCNSYAQEVSSAQTLIKFRKTIIIVPTLLLIVLGIILAIVATPACLIVSALGLLYCGIIIPTLSSVFKKLCATICDKYKAFYKPSSSAVSAVIVDDNKGFAVKCSKGNPLFCWLETEQLNYIASNILGLRNCVLKRTSLSQFNSLVNSDFGRLCVPLKDIDHYREGTLVCKYGSEICKIKFQDDKAFDIFIAQKEYYFITEKKGLLS
ncbi:MAG: hypothetical protein HDT36_02305 [Clostridiales bacterium]|nr:hypothetical protein [Clostridiales bacterium]